MANNKAEIWTKGDADVTLLDLGFPIQTVQDLLTANEELNRRDVRRLYQRAALRHAFNLKSKEFAIQKAYFISNKR